MYTYHSIRFLKKYVCFNCTRKAYLKSNFKIKKKISVNKFPNVNKNYSLNYNYF